MVNLPKISRDWTPTDSEYRSYNALNFHTLADFHRDPRAWKDGAFDQEPNAAMMFGTAFHSAILEPLTFNDRVAVFAPPVNSKTGEPFGVATKAYKDAAAAFETENAGKIAITTAEMATIDAMEDSIRLHPIAFKILRGRRFALNELAIKGELEVDGDMLPVKAKIDVYNDSGLVDLKTTAQLCDASGRERFRAACYDYKYILQIAYYKLLLVKLYGVPETLHCYFVAAETTAPYRVAVYHIADDVVSSATLVIWAWLSEYAAALRSNVYTSKFDAIQIIDKYNADRDI